MPDALTALVSGWQLEPVPIVAAVCAAALYARGARMLGAWGCAPRRGQVACFALGLTTIVVALVSPLDSEVGRLQWAHMLQHLLLLIVAPPLVVLGRPVDTACAALRPGVARAVRAVLARPVTRRGAGTVAATAVVAVTIAVLWAWHVPALYDLTLRNEAVHDLEHTTFLATGLLFWTLALGRPAWSPHLGEVGRAVVVLAGMIGAWMLAVYIGYAPGPLYAYTGTATLSAVSDQQIAAGIMWVPGSVPYIAVLTALLVRWFENDARAAAAERRGAAV